MDLSIAFQYLSIEWGGSPANAGLLTAWAEGERMNGRLQDLAKIKGNLRVFPWSKSKGLEVMNKDSNKISC